MPEDQPDDQHLFELEATLATGVNTIRDVVAGPKAAIAFAWMQNEWLPSFDRSDVMDWTFSVIRPRVILGPMAAESSSLDVLAANNGDDSAAVNRGIGECIKWDNLSPRGRLEAGYRVAS